MKQSKYILLFIAAILLTGIGACKEEGRYEPERNGGVPGTVSNVTYQPLYGGARFFYDIPDDEDLLQIEAEYTNKQNKTFMFTSSYFVDSLDVYGFPDMNEYTVKLYAVNRAGERSAAYPVTVNPLEPAYTRVLNSIEVKPGFSSFFLDWVNELEQNVNVYVDFDYTQNGESHNLLAVFSSNLEEDRRFVNDLELSNTDPVHVRVRVEDMYGNITDFVDKGTIYLLEDIKIPKELWELPNPNDSIGGVPMCFGDAKEGRNRYVIDDIIDRGGIT
ncbi:MAG: DUF4959 domain-containing protein [Tannerellaceae bacterium]|nr:DUF4959 domain-containing protein [Tannerellaceae bacterium]